MPVLVWGGSWEKVHNVQIFSFCFFTDSYNGFNEETSVENRLKKYWGITKLRHFCDMRLHAYVWRVMTLIVVFSTLRLETLCTFSHEPPRIIFFSPVCSFQNCIQANPSSSSSSSLSLSLSLSLSFSCDNDRTWLDSIWKTFALKLVFYKEIRATLRIW